MTQKLEYMRLEMEKVQDPISKPKLTGAQTGKQKDMTDSENLQNTYSNPTQIPTLVTTNIPAGISKLTFEKYMQNKYHYGDKGLCQGKSDRKDQEHIFSESDNDSYTE